MIDIWCIYARKNSQVTHLCGVKLLVWKSGCVKFWTNTMSDRNVSIKEKKPFLTLPSLLLLRSCSTWQKIFSNILKNGCIYESFSLLFYPMENPFSIPKWFLGSPAPLLTYILDLGLFSCIFVAAKAAISSSDNSVVFFISFMNAIIDSSSIFPPGLGVICNL